MRVIQSSNNPGVRALIDGKDPIAPARHEATTSSGVDTLNIGATTSGSFSRSVRPRAVCRSSEGEIKSAMNRGSPENRSKAGGARSEEHTSELQSLMRISYAVFCLKKK